MAARPTINTPRFSTANTANIEPPLGKKTAGWSVNERPPAQWLSWLQWSAGEWIDYAAQVFSGTPITDLAINAANPSASIPVIDVTSNADAASTQYKLLFRFALGTTRHARIYVGSSGSTRRFVIVQNATWNGTAWACDDAAGPAAAIALRGGGIGDVFELLFHAATGSTWADAAWLTGGFSALVADTLHITNPGPSIAAQIEGPTVIRGDTFINANLGCVGFESQSVTTEDLRVNTSISLDDDVEIAYEAGAQPWRYIQLNPADAAFIGPANNFGLNYDPIHGYFQSSASDDLTLEWGLDVPRECLEWNVEVLWMAPDSAHANSFGVLRNVRDFTTASSTPPDTDPIDSRTQTVYSSTLASYANLLTSITGPARRADAHYCVRVAIKANAAGTNRLYGVRLAFRDPGPRNG